MHREHGETWLIHGKYFRSSLDPVYSQEVEELDVEVEEVEDQEVEEQERVVVVVKARALTG